MTYVKLNLLAGKVPDPLPKEIRALCRYARKYAPHFGLMIVGTGLATRYFVDRQKTETFLRTFDPNFKIKTVDK